MPPHAPRAALRPLHRAWRALPARARRRLLAHGSALLAPRAEWPAPRAAHGLAVAGELARASGLGEGARAMLAALATLGVPHWPVRAGLPVPGEPDALPVHETTPPAGAPLVLHVNAPSLGAALLRLPRPLRHGRRRIGYWSWELPTIDPAWRAGAPLVHEIWVPSRFTAAALEPLAPGRIRVVPHPVAAAWPTPSARTRASFGLPPHAFLVLTSFSLASSFERKNPLAAIAAFTRAFGTSPNHHLVLKLAYADQAPDDLARLQAATAGAPNITLLTTLLSPPDRHALTACADAVLSLHRSEGFGLVVAEAMALGRPVLSTDWSATTEFLDASCGLPIPYRLIPARDPRAVFEAPGAVWADADTAAAADALVALAEDPARAQALGQAARARVAERLTAQPLEEALHALGLA
jgi:glycosyltransferase involved in cell wall biosynthesis